MMVNQWFGLDDNVLDRFKSMNPDQLDSWYPALAYPFTVQNSCSPYGRRIYYILTPPVSTLFFHPGIDVQRVMAPVHHLCGTIHRPPPVFSDDINHPPMALEP